MFQLDYRSFYGYYKDKEELFTSIVSEVADGLIERFKSAQEAHFDLIENGSTKTSRELSTNYLKGFMEYIYDNFDIFKLIICRSDGTSYQNYVHDLVELDVKVASKYFEMLRNMGKLEGEVSANLHHMITSAYFAAVFETVAHDMSRKEAEGYINDLATFFNSGWESLLKIK